MPTVSPHASDCQVVRMAQNPVLTWEEHNYCSLNRSTPGDPI